MKRYETTYDDGDYPLKESPDGEWVRYEDVVNVFKGYVNKSKKFRLLRWIAKQMGKELNDLINYDEIINSLSGD